MSIVGFEDAFDSSSEFLISSREGSEAERAIRSVRVLTLPALVVLKLVAWQDRQGDELDRKSRRKHVSDIYFIMEHYSMIRAFSEEEFDWREIESSPTYQGAYILT